MAGFDELMDGYRRFRSNRWESEKSRWRELAEGQTPHVMVIACCDSRADPATIFDADPGEIFVVRNVANLVPPFERGGGRHGVSAALEFAVTQLEVAEIVVMGHERCGGIAAALTGQFHDAAEGEGGFIADWMEQIDAHERGHRRRAWHRPGGGAAAGRRCDPPERRQSAHLPVRRGARELGKPRDPRLPFLDLAKAAFMCSTRRKMSSAPPEQMCTLTVANRD